MHGAAILCLAHGFRGTYAAFTWRATLAQIACIAVQSAGHLAEVLAITHAPGHSGSTAAGAAPQAAFSLVFPYLLHGLVLSVQQASVNISCRTLLLAAFRMTQIVQGSCMPSGSAKGRWRMLCCMQQPFRHCRASATNTLTVATTAGSMLIWVSAKHCFCAAFNLY